jgi:hypothetical protein
LSRQGVVAAELPADLTHLPSGLLRGGDADGSVAAPVEPAWSWAVAKTARRNHLFKQGRAAAEIHAQIVDQVSRAAVTGAAMRNGASVGAANVFEGGDFGTVAHGPNGPDGPRSKVGLLLDGNALSHVVDVATVAAQVTGRRRPGRWLRQRP